MRSAFDRLAPDWRKDPAFVPWTSPVVPWESADAKRRKALRAAWKRGNLAYKLNPDQRSVYDAFRAWESDPRRGPYYGLDISRQWGKSFDMVLIGIEDCIRGQRTDRAAYWTSTERMAQEIVHPIVDTLLSDCPPDLRPKWIASKKKYRFPDGQELEVLGLDDPNRARGRYLDRGYLDEQAFMENLEYIVTSVIHPQMQTRNRPYVLMGTTPPLSPQHYWSSHLIHLLRAEGATERRTIYDNPMLSNEKIKATIDALGGETATAVRRELFAEHVIESSMAIVPEYLEVRDSVYIDLPDRPDWYAGFVSLDPGWKDASGVLFAYVDFDESELRIEDEIYATQLSSREIAEAVKKKEAELWPRPARWSRGKQEALPNPYRRWTDVDNRLVADLAMDHGLVFAPTAKDNKDQQVNRVRNWIATGRIKISKRCVQLDRQLQTGVYRNENRKDFARSEGFGHFDLIDALIYLARNVEPYLRYNPKPPALHGANPSRMFIHAETKKTRRLEHRPGRLRNR